MKERNLLYVEWDNQSVQYSDSKLYTWEKSIFVKAKDNYIGGNNVTTNASASGVIINGGIKEFDTPTVNVKVNGTLKCRENVIFYGENITSADYEMSEMFKLNGNIREDGNALTEQDEYLIYDVHIALSKEHRQCAYSLPRRCHQPYKALKHLIELVQNWL